jgi:hypothetical protein
MPPRRGWMFRCPKRPRTLLLSKISTGACDPRIYQQVGLPNGFPDEQITSKFRTVADPLKYLWNQSTVRDGGDKIVRGTQHCKNTTFKRVSCGNGQ